MICSRKLLSKQTQKRSQTEFFSEENIFRVKKLNNSHNDVVNIPNKTWKVEVSEEKMFCKIESFRKEIMVSVGT